MRRLTGRLAFALLPAAALVVVLPAAAAHADGGVIALPISSFYQIVADPAHGHLFISQGSNSFNDIIVTNLQGQEVATIGGQDGVMGIALSPDGSTLYAALAGDHAVSAISTATLQQTASYPIGNTDIPRDVAVQAGKVWVSYGTGVPGEGAIGDINLTASPPAFEAQAAMGGWISAPDLAADPSDSGVLVAAEPGGNPPSEASYDVLADPVTVIASAPYNLACNFVSDLAMVRGGTEFLLACGGSAVPRYKTADLSEQGSYAVSGNPDAVAIDTSGDVAIGTEFAGGGSNLYIYRQGADTPVNTLDPGPAGTVASRGLAWAPDGSQLFAVLITSPFGSLQPPTYALDVLDSPTQPASQLTLSGTQSSITFGQSVTLSGSLTPAPGSPAPPAGTPVTIVRIPYGATPDETLSVPIGADGSFSLTDTPPGAGQFTYIASYGGNATAGPATSAPLGLTVSSELSSLSLETNKSVYGYGSTVTLTAHLGPAGNNGQVSIEAQILGTNFLTVLATDEVVNANGDLSVRVRATQSTHFTAQFFGDADYTASNAATDIAVRAGISASLGGYYQSRRSAQTTYRVYHQKKTLRVHAAVRPNKGGECVSFQTQKYYRGAWRAASSTGCYPLSGGSALTAGFGLRHDSVGSRYRIRVLYGGDISNLGADSSWQYYIVKR